MKNYSFTKQYNKDPTKKNILVVDDDKSIRFILKTLLEIIPEDPQVLRLSVQAAAFTKNKAFGDYAISLMKIHNPGAVSLAQDFLNNALN